MMIRMTAAVIFYTLCAFYGASAFYLPGLAPVNFCKAGETTGTCKVRGAKIMEGILLVMIDVFYTCIY